MKRGRIQSLFAALLNNIRQLTRLDLLRAHQVLTFNLINTNLPQGQSAKINIQDRELLRRFEALDSAPEHDKALAKEFLDLSILKNSFQKLASGPESQPVQR